MISPGIEAFGSLLPSTETSISRAATDFSTRIFIANSQARFSAGASSARECTFVIPTDEPSAAGLTKTGYLNFDSIVFWTCLGFFPFVAVHRDPGHDGNLRNLQKFF